MPPSLEERISLVSKLPISPSGGHVSHCRVQSIKEQVIGAGWKHNLVGVLKIKSNMSKINRKQNLYSTAIYCTKARLFSENLNLG